MNQGIQGCLNHELLSDVYITDAHIAPRVLRHVYYQNLLMSIGEVVNGHFNLHL